MKTKDLCMLFAGLFMVGCSADEEIANVSTSESNAISFNVVSNNPQTKATMINSTDELKQHNLEVFAFKDDAYYMGSNTDGRSWSDHGVELTYKVNCWDYTDADATYYWPHQEALDFYAVAPSESVDESSFNLVSISPSTKQFACYLSDENKAIHVDAMYAMKLGVKKDDAPNGTVQLKFKHALSQIVFKAKKNDKSQSVTVEIKRMQLYNVANKGTFTFPGTGQANGKWVTDPTTKSFYNIDFVANSSITVESGRVVTNLSDGKPLLCIPQTLIAWDHSSSNPITGDRENEITDIKGFSFLRIECKIYDGNHYFVGGEDNYGYTYVPFSAIWEEGKRYIYTLCFGAGYNANGSEIDIVPITFDAEVTDWVNEDSDITDF